MNTTEQIFLVSVFAIGMAVYDYMNVKQFHKGYILGKEVDRPLAGAPE